MAILDESGFWHGKWGNVIYCLRNGTYFTRDVPQSVADPKTPKQKFWRWVSKEVAKKNIICLIANAALQGKKLSDGKFSPPDDYYTQLLSSNMLAISCGWGDLAPMLLLPDGKHMSAKAEFIWGDIVKGSIVGLAFVPPAPWKYVKMALRIKLALAYHSYYMGYIVVGAVQIPVEKNPSPNSLLESFEALPDIFVQKAYEFVHRRWGNLNDAIAKMMLAGARFIQFKVTTMPVPKRIFGVDKIKFTDISGGKVHIKVDLIGMKEMHRGEWVFRCAIKSSPLKSKNDYIIKLPKHKLGKLGEKIAQKVYKFTKARHDKYLSNPQKYAENVARYKKWYQKHHEEILKYFRSRQEIQNARRRERYNTDSKYRKKCIQRAKEYARKKKNK